MSLHTNDIQNHSFSHWTHFNPFNLVCITDIGSLTIPGIHEVPRPEVPRYKESLGPRAVSTSGGISLDMTIFETALVQMFPILLRWQRDYTLALSLLMLRDPSPSIVLHLQAGEGGSAKKTLRIWCSCIKQFYFL